MGYILQGGQIYQGSNATQPKIFSGSIESRYAFLGQDWIWAGLEFSGSPSSVIFVPDTTNGGQQGDFSIGTNSSTSKYKTPQNADGTLYEIDPAGGTCKFSVCSRDLCYWHKFAPILSSYVYTTSTNAGTTVPKVTFNTISDSNNRSGTITVVGTVKKTFDVNGNLNIVGTKPKTTNQPLDNTYWPNKSNKTDYTITFNIGPNNTDDSTYMNIDLLGFLNEKLVNEYFTTKYNFGKLSYTTPNSSRNVPFTNGLEGKRYLINKTLPTDKIPVLKIWQKPNITISFYTHIAFIDPSYTSYDELPPENMIISNYRVDWSTIVGYILLFVEFGASSDKGKNILWNGQEKTNSLGATLLNKGVSTTVPTNIDKYLTFNMYDYTTIITESGKIHNRYELQINKATIHGSKAWKFIKIPISSRVENNSASNPPDKRTQKYNCINFEPIITTTTATSADDKNINSDKKYNSSNPSLSDKYLAKYNANSRSGIKFQIGVSTTTEDWKTSISINLNYTKGIMKYVGSTNGK